MEIENKKYQIKIWDTAGQEKFAVMAKNYYKRAHGMIIACAINNRSTFDNLRIWLNSVKEKAESEIQIILIANKCDLEEEREVKKKLIIKNRIREPIRVISHFFLRYFLQINFEVNL